MVHGLPDCAGACRLRQLARRTKLLQTSCEETTSTRTTPDSCKFGCRRILRSAAAATSESRNPCQNGGIISARSNHVGETMRTSRADQDLMLGGQGENGQEGGDGGTGTTVAMVLCVLPMECRLSFRKLRRALRSQGEGSCHAKPLGLASPEEAEESTGCQMGMVPPVCIEPKLPVFVDMQLFEVGCPSNVVVGAAHPSLHLTISSRVLLSEAEAAIADLSSIPGADDSDEPAPANKPAPVLFPLRAGGGTVVHAVVLVAAVRRLSRQLLFADLLPPGSDRDSDRSIWLSPDGSGRPMRLQLLVGRSLAERVGQSGAASVIKRLRAQQLIYVAGRLQLEELGEQYGRAIPSAPEEVRKKREAQFDNGIVDMVAEQIRILEEVHVPSQQEVGSARKVGAKKNEAPAAPDEPTLALAIPDAVHLVSDRAGLKKLENVLRERLSGSADLPESDSDQPSAATVTPLLPIVGIDAEWRPKSPTGIALLQLSFRRSVFLLDMVLMQDDEELWTSLARILRTALEAEHLYKVGFGLDVDLQRLASTLPAAMPEDVRSIIDLRDLAREALPDLPPALGLSSLTRTVFGRGLDKTWQVSDWQARPLEPEQLEYAAQDAHVCVRLFDSLCYNHATLATQQLPLVLGEVARTWRYWSGTEGRPGLKARLQDAERRVGVFRGQFGSRVWRLKVLKVLEILRPKSLGLLGSINP
ncbi:mut-7 [Symbiodinium necroappetens]|uniref:Mut-7 protein n=1 Tax=Symbiodinium necroappetens TaxID=1628268 RepID=A0A812K1G7_9DINO|nr:mut-7 [Symbiodinium necroappetens]